ncbi:MAG TPA: hypothetical protein VHY08_29815 [Bacillota bacterium]|nr:hypothetical protein [Bacillota bacterium]
MANAMVNMAIHITDGPSLLGLLLNVKVSPNHIGNKFLPTFERQV